MSDPAILIEGLSKEKTTTIRCMLDLIRPGWGVVRLLMHRPELLLLDEPTSGLDPLMQKKVLRLIRKARAEGATVFFSSHIISEVEDVADRVAIIRDGQVAEIVAIQDTRRRSIRRVHVHLKQAVSPEALAAITGVTAVARDEEGSFTLQVEGDMNALFKALAAIGVSEIETERVSLEETFMAQFYDTLAAQRTMLENLISRYPRELMALFGGGTNIFSPQGFLSMEFFSIMPVVLGIYAILSGSSLLMSDEEMGCRDLLRTHPVSRTRFFMGRVIVVVAFVLLAWLLFS